MPYSLHEPRPEHRLRHRRPVSHREHLAARTDELLRRAVTVEAPLHLQRVLLQHQRHLVDPPVARLASHALLHVDAVVEVDEVRQVVHPNPAQRIDRRGSSRGPVRESAPSPRSASGSSCRSWSAEFRRTPTFPPTYGSTGSRCRRRRRGGVAELNRLLDELFGARHIGRPAKDDEETDQPAGQEKDADNTDPREGIGAATKYLRHRLLTVGAPATGRHANAIRSARGAPVSGGPFLSANPICTTL